jgi:hypothetical protein
MKVQVLNISLTAKEMSQDKMEFQMYDRTVATISLGWSKIK